MCACCATTCPLLACSLQGDYSVPNPATAAVHLRYQRAFSAFFVHHTLVFSFCKSPPFSLQYLFFLCRFFFLFAGLAGGSCLLLKAIYLFVFACPSVDSYLPRSPTEKQKRRAAREGQGTRESTSRQVDKEERAATEKEGPGGRGRWEVRGHWCSAGSMLGPAVWKLRGAQEEWTLGTLENGGTAPPRRAAWTTTAPRSGCATVRASRAGKSPVNGEFPKLLGCLLQLFGYLHTHVKNRATEHQCRERGEGEEGRGAHSVR